MKENLDLNTSKLKWCVIVPTYNNAGTLRQVLDSILAHSDSVIVVNDGSFDNTSEILLSFGDRIDVISLPQNQGKGVALRTGFERAHALGFSHAITMDSDGQHFASDIPLFVTEIVSAPHELVIGARNMKSENVPDKSSFGNKFSNFWYKLETGKSLTDTQSGYRLYPLHAMQNLNFYTKKFEFEIEVIVKAAWSGIKVKNIPILVHYDTGEKRISHFRPFRDFTRISVLNTYFVILAVVYYIPIRFYRKASYGNFKAFLREHFLNKDESIALKSMSIGFGVFMGIFPVWGFQMLIGVVIAHFLKLNKAIFLVAANISIPPLIPIILFISFQMGGVFFPDSTNDFFFSEGITLDDVKMNAAQYFSGAILFALVAGIIAGLLSAVLIYFYRKAAATIS